MSNGRSGFTLIELMIVVVIIGILAAIAIPNFMLMKDRAREASVKSNCHTVQLAAEDFAVQNNEVYAKNNQDTTPDGETLFDIIPGRVSLVNPFTKADTEPTFVKKIPLKGKPGSTLYCPKFENGEPVGFEIAGYGRKGNQVILLTSGI